jgi:hypothetical protein
MTAPVRDLRSFMLRNGWVEQPPGVAGALWRRASEASNQPDVIGVPDNARPGSTEWRGVIERLARAQGETSEEVGFRVDHEHIDVTDLRAANDTLITGSIPLASGAQLVLSAQKMLRASATTARGSKAQIGGGYLRDGDRVAAKARMGHTKAGSYIIPILMPIPTYDSEMPEEEPFEGMDAAVVRREPIERRTMRTFAQALTAVSRLIVQPGIQPTSALVPPLVAAGVSREFVMALRDIVEEHSVSKFDATFSWAGAVAPPRDVPEVIDIPRESGELLAEAAQQLKAKKREPNQTFTGPIVEWHHVPQEPQGWIGIQTMRAAREMTVRVYLSEADIYRAVDYMRDSQTVVIEGTPVGGRGKPVEIFEPSRFISLAETMIPQSD